MSRYIDADKLIKFFPDDGEGNWTYNVTAQSYINTQPTANMVEVVRCKDCKWWKSIFSWNGKEHKVCVRESAEPPRESDDYCSYGERREDAEAVNKKN